MEPPPLDSLLLQQPPPTSPPNTNTNTNTFTTTKAQSPSATFPSPSPQPNRLDHATPVISKMLASPSPPNPQQLLNEQENNRFHQGNGEPIPNCPQLNENPTMLEQMITAAGAANAAKSEKKAQEMQAMDKTFGASLKGGFEASRAKQRDDLILANSFKSHGNQSLKEGKVDVAVEYYTKALKLKGDSKVLYSNRSLALLKLGKKREAREDAEKAIALDPHWPKAYLRKASALLAEGDASAAANCYEACLRCRSVKEDSKQKKAIEALYQRDLPEAYNVYIMPVVKPSTSSDEALRFDDVQEAMRSDGVEQLKTGAWVNDGFVEKLAGNPKLAKALADPAFANILQSMQTNPVETMKALESKPEAKEIVTELLKVVGDHLSNLDTSNPSDAKAQTQARARTGIMSEEESKLQAEANKVLEDSQVRSVLQDPETKKVLQMCGNPACLAQYMRHPKWGPRIRLLQQKGLVQFRS